ncbi:3-dehydroquinate synthase [Sphingomicrobium sediminis]|uniref:3-dehydroquinate synthase n=1 Tax=Sphingomicrobium sediminis TaxID=2950949 RepID=A0A9X2EEZ6_9SPHN|nr:3-dehydroquinate synthase [Sphingomicrobium sediminis]MCM8556370.1 3-dehydroquinate synthase [Sphingomicrobium sediminis]
MIRLDVPGKPGATYKVRVGALDSGLAELDLPTARPLACISDPHIWDLHGDKLAAIAPVDTHLLPRGEAGKTWEHLQATIAFLAARNQQRDEPIIAFGGGAVGDLTGLAAALYRRGTPVIQVPTTLLAQVDSSVGGKTAIDAEGQKNLVGAFHPPAAVIADPALLATLDEREVTAGLAETVKYGLIGDRKFYDWLVSEGGKSLRDHNADAAARAIATAVEAKASYVRGDLEDRTGRRALLNLGHTFGHAIESIAGLGTVLHGEAVAIGMVLAARFSEAQGHASDIAEKVAADFRAIGLPTSLDDAGLAGRGSDLLDPMLHDKKNERGEIRLILLRDIGDAFMATDVAEAELGGFLRSL